MYYTELSLHFVIRCTSLIVAYCSLHYVIDLDTNVFFVQAISNFEERHELLSLKGKRNVAALNISLYS